MRKEKLLGSLSGDRHSHIGPHMTVSLFKSQLLATSKHQPQVVHDRMSPNSEETGTTMCRERAWEEANSG